MGRLGLWPGPTHVVDRLGTGMRVSAGFQIFASTARRKCPRGREIVRRGKEISWEYVRGGANVPHSHIHRCDDANVQLVPVPSYLTRDTDPRCVTQPVTTQLDCCQQSSSNNKHTIAVYNNGRHLPRSGHTTAVTYLMTD